MLINSVFSALACFELWLFRSSYLDCFTRPRVPTGGCFSVCNRKCPNQRYELHHHRIEPGYGVEYTIHRFWRPLLTGQLYSPLSIRDRFCSLWETPLLSFKLVGCGSNTLGATSRMHL